MGIFRIYFLLYSSIAICQKFEKFPQEFDSVCYQNWVGGQELSGGGTDFYIDFKNPLQSDIKLVTLYFRNHKLNIETLSSTKFIARYSYRPELIIDEYGNRKIVRKPEVNSKPKYILKDNEAVIEYIRGKKKKICKLKNVKEKEFLAYP
jgi:hypothetical protein